MSDVVVEASSARPEGESVVRVVGLAVVVGLVVGMVTSPAQGWLTDATRSLANSAGPWSLAAFLVARASRRPALGALLASITLAMCELGYVIASELRDIPTASSTVVFWLSAAVLAGPPLGIAAAWTRSSTNWRIGAGYGVVAGVLLGEAIYGLTQISDTTEPPYWFLEALCGVAVIVFVGARYPHVPAVASTLAVAAAAAVILYVAAITV